MKIVLTYGGKTHNIVWQDGWAETNGPYAGNLLAELHIVAWHGMVVAPNSSVGMTATLDDPWAVLGIARMLSETPPVVTDIGGLPPEPTDEVE